ncbi:phospholipase D-like domain-containing protein [Tuwongella immobilis]|uniref:phospholipase D n=1 Tax=Tuwongella immobilis TaxID=692036 RepID=A0A6C2YQC6_9BACT|nr:phospholipase D-like domain-containing protein [Tuwongella immobilis]VIP03215.1 phospholipase d : Phospholipase D/Transphosphatidylase OS=candidate division ZIXI bacterium RBG-1 GN=RBG1_1C00001G1652 PE=4 SV=1: PLDc_2: PLDc_2 [Tuwongella immobilis]VTS03733.1 phospholipase d : Phospholipase D/Transphosphatidylase OS=candidate division ZIXI bacterium RBG-1 GN=RBG1_1C00001G1652 PE=4 SV=1: PLDc_2: PLDc_2 [Tuwongella immobilis]
MTMRGVAAALCLVFIVGSGPRLRAEERPPIQIFFGPQSADTPNGLIRNLLRFFDSAESTLDGAIHEVDLILVAQRLVDRSKAGVRVRLVVEADWWNNEKNTAARKLLQTGGVTIIPDTRKSGLMHNKFFIADRKRVWTGSTNMTETCLLVNPNNSLWLESRELAANYEAIFDAYRDGKFGKRAVGKWDNPHPVVMLGDAEVTTLFSPKDDPLPKIVAEIDRAKRSIDVMVFVFSSQEVGEAILRAHRRGVAVRVLLDNQYASDGITRRWPFVPFREFRKVGIAVKFDDEDAKLHHKVILIDGITTLTGSFNFSLSAADTNDENMLVIRSQSITATYQREFERLWKLYPGTPGNAPTPERGDGDSP